MEAIRVAGWLGLLTLGLLWPFALIWAFTKSGDGPDDGREERLDRLQERVKALEEHERGGTGQ